MKYVALFCCLCLLFSCGDTSSEAPADTSETVSPAPAPNAPRGRPIVNAEPREDVVLYPWLDRLNLREAPSTKGKVLAKIERKQPLTFTGRQSDKAESIVLRGAVYHEPWLEVTTKDGKTGWVFGGTVAAEGVRKGNPAVSEKKFDFPGFGKFNLNNWEASGSETTEEGDTETTKWVYTGANQRLEITKSSTGEYGYENLYRLLDGAGNLQKERAFTFSIDPFLITEVVTDYLSIPAVRYVRSQELDKHYLMLNEYPELVRGEWATEPVAE